jgi:hypothetical protein
MEKNSAKMASTQKDHTPPPKYDNININIKHIKNC